MHARFEDLPVWKQAIELTIRVYQLTHHPLFSQPGDLCGQLRRAAFSVSNSIAEGFKPDSTAELLAFSDQGSGWLTVVGGAGSELTGAPPPWKNPA